MYIPHLAIAITFHYKEDRLKYLNLITQAHRNLAERVTTYIITNADNADQIIQISKYSRAQNQTIITPTHLGHPFLLPWCHRSVFSSIKRSEPSVTHFLYTEDDILFTQDNLRYWLSLSPLLKTCNGIPGFIRYELDNEGSKISADFTRPLYLDSTYSFVHSNIRLVCLIEPYQAFYFLESEQMDYLLDNETGSPDEPSTFGIWGIREKAAQGLAFWKKDVNYPSNYFVKVNQDNEIDPHALVHHLPNTYVQISDTPYGKIPIIECIQNSMPRKIIERPSIWRRIKIRSRNFTHQ
jgi:hypothetical protein